jgi:hypothetical protein
MPITIHSALGTLTPALGLQREQLASYMTPSNIEMLISNTKSLSWIACQLFFLQLCCVEVAM